MKGSHETKKTIEESFQDAQKLGKEIDEGFSETAKKMLNQGMTPKDAMGINPSYLENIYAQAYRLYNTGKYAEAAHLFRILIMFNAMEPKYMLGLAACFHMLKEYVNAIQTYTMCSALDPQNPIPHYHSSDCFIQMKEYLSAMLCLELAIERAGNKSEFVQMKERAQLGLKSLKEQVSSHPLEEQPQSSKEMQNKPQIF